MELEILKKNISFIYEINNSLDDMSFFAKISFLSVKEREDLFNSAELQEEKDIMLTVNLSEFSEIEANMVKLYRRIINIKSEESQKTLDLIANLIVNGSTGFYLFQQSLIEGAEDKDFLKAFKELKSSNSIVYTALEFKKMIKDEISDIEFSAVFFKEESDLSINKLITIKRAIDVFMELKRKENDGKAL